MGERVLVAEMVEGKSNFWKCRLCEMPESEFVTKMFTHLFLVHRVKSISQDWNEGRVFGLVEGGPA